MANTQEGGYRPPSMLRQALDLIAQGADPDAVRALAGGLLPLEREILENELRRPGEKMELTADRAIIVARSKAARGRVLAGIGGDRGVQDAAVRYSNVVKRAAGPALRATITTPPGWRPRKW